MKAVFSNATVLLLAALIGHAQTPPAGADQTQLHTVSAVPTEPIAAIVEAFRSHAVVAQEGTQIHAVPIQVVSYFA